jgi:hypothetical protein
MAKRRKNGLFSKLFSSRETYRATRAPRRAVRPVSEKALAKQAKEREAERLERKLSDAQFEAKLRKHYARGGNLREFLQANPGVSGAQFKRCVAAVAAKAKAGRKRVAAMGKRENPSKERITLQRVGNRIYLVNDGGARVAYLQDGSKSITYDPLASLDEVMGSVNYRSVVRDLGLTPTNIRQISARDSCQRIRAANSFSVIDRAGDRYGRVNPSDAAADVYEEFHGRPSGEVVTVVENIHHHEHLAALGELRTLVVKARNGARVTLTRFKKAILCTNEAKNQMFVRGGDQSVDVGVFGIRNPHEVETLGQVVEIVYFTTKDHLGDEGGTALYFHVTGETNENGKRKMAGWPPDLIYHTVDERMEFSGGSYSIKAEGVDK